MQHQTNKYLQRRVNGLALALQHFLRLSWSLWRKLARRTRHVLTGTAPHKAHWLDEIRRAKPFIMSIETRNFSRPQSNSYLFIFTAYLWQFLMHPSSTSCWRYPSCQQLRLPMMMFFGVRRLLCFYQNISHPNFVIISKLLGPTMISYEYYIFQFKYHMNKIKTITRV